MASRACMSHQAGMHTAHSCGKGSAAALQVNMKQLQLMQRQASRELLLSAISHCQQKIYQQGGDVGLKVQGCNSCKGDGVGCQRCQHHNQQGLHQRHDPEQSTLEEALGPDDCACTHTQHKRVSPVR